MFNLGRKGKGKRERRGKKKQKKEKRKKMGSFLIIRHSAEKDQRQEQGEPRLGGLVKPAGRF